MAAHKIKGWIARDDDFLCCFKRKPELEDYGEDGVTWTETSGGYIELPAKWFPEIKPGDEPAEVEITITRK